MLKGPACLTNEWCESTYGTLTIYWIYFILFITDASYHPVLLLVTRFLISTFSISPLRILYCILFFFAPYNTGISAVLNSLFGPYNTFFSFRNWVVVVVVE